MVSSKDEYQIYREDKIDFPALIKNLSFHKSFPCNVHIRNHFLAQYGAIISHPDLVGKKVDKDPWKTYLDYRKGAVVAVIGDVPGDILKGDSLQKEEGLWALVLVYPSYAPGWKKLSKEDEMKSNGIWNSIRTTFWLSSELPFDQEVVQPDQTRKATDQERNLLKFIFEKHIPNALQHTYSHSIKSSSITKMDDMVKSDLHAVNHIWLKELQSIQDDIGIPFKITRCNPCVTFTMSEENSDKLSNQINTDRWKFGTIGENDKDELEMVIKTNGIAFPIYYIQSRKHISIMMYDQEKSKEEDENGQENEKEVYPTKIKFGAPSGWAYSHDDYSLGSLHVAEPYRRIRSNQTNEPIRVGTICVALMADKLIKSQREALKMAGFQNDYDQFPNPVVSDAELKKTVAVAFHKSVGFQPKTLTSWGEYIMKI